MHFFSPVECGPFDPHGPHWVRGQSRSFPHAPLWRMPPSVPYQSSPMLRFPTMAMADFPFDESHAPPLKPVIILKFTIHRMPVSGMGAYESIRVANSAVLSAARLPLSHGATA